MANAAGDAHAYPIYGGHFLVTFPILDADGDPVTGATGLDSEVSIDLGTFADCTNEATEIATSSGSYYLYVTGAEMTGKVITIQVKTSSSGAKTTVLTLHPIRLPVMESDTAEGGAGSTITFAVATASAKDNFYNGMFVLITNNSPAGAQYQIRRVLSYVGSTRVATVDSAWGTNPSSASTYSVLTPEGYSIKEWAGGKLSDPATAGIPDVNTKNAGNTAWGSGAITAASIAADAITAAKLASDVATEISAPVVALLPTALVGGRMDSSVGAMAAGVLTATAIAADAITAAKLASDVATEIAAPVVALLPTALVGGKIDAHVNDIAASAITASAIATDAITAAKIAADAIGASELASDAVTEIQSGLSTLTAAGIRTAVGLASANLDTQLAEIEAETDDIAAIKAVTDAIPDAGALTTLQTAVTDIQGDVDIVETRVVLALPAAAPQAAGGLITSTAGALDLDELNTDIEAIQTGVAAIPTTPVTTAHFDTIIGTPVVSVSADLAEIEAETDGIAGLTSLDAAGIRTAIGLASANLDTQLAEIEAETDGIAGLTALDAAGIRAAVGLAAANLDTQLAEIEADVDLIPTTTPITAADVWAVVVEDAITALQSMRLQNAAAAGKVSGAAPGTTSIILRDLADTLNRIAATVDSNGNRTAITLDLA